MNVFRLFILFICLFIFPANEPKKVEMNNKEVESETVSQELEYTEHFRERVTFYEFESVKNKMPESLEKYLGDALLNDTLIENLLKIEAEYEILNGDSKDKFLNNCKDIYLLSYEYYEGTDSDIWYLVDLYEKDDIVIWHQTKENTNILFFENYGNSYWKALGVGRLRKDQPYFIHWEDENYLAIPYWDDCEENIIGVTVHIYDNQSDKHDVVGIGIDQNSQITTCYQAYNIGNYGGSPWYRVK